MLVVDEKHIHVYIYSNSTCMDSTDTMPEASLDNVRSSRIVLMMIDIS